jgi:hypothetical protein
MLNFQISRIFLVSVGMGLDPDPDPSNKFLSFFVGTEKHLKSLRSVAILSIHLANLMSTCVQIRIGLIADPDSGELNQCGSGSEP